MTTLDKPVGRDDRHSAVFGAYHVHRCEWCGVPVACFNGPDCDLAATHGHCSQECHDHSPELEIARADQPVVGL